MSLWYSRSKDSFELLLDAGEAKCDVKKQEPFQLLLSVSVLLVLGFLSLSIVTTTKSSVADDQATSSSLHHEHTLPTLLSIVDPESGKYINAIENPLYQELKNMEMLEHRFLRRTDENDLPLLTLDRTHLSNLYQSLTVSWTAGSDPSVMDEDDIVALYCPADADHGSFREAATLKQVSATSQHHGGDPSLRDEWYIPSFPITKHTSCQFRLFDRSPSDTSMHTTTLQLLATSPTLHIPSATRTPTGIHLALSENPMEMIISFSTAEKGTPLAMYGLHDGEKNKIEGTSHTYTANDLCGAPANVTEVGKFQDPGMLHVVRLSQLQPNQAYVYKVGLVSGQGITWSDELDFIAPPVVGDATNFSYIVYGDQGCPAKGWGNGSLWTADMVARSPDIRMVHHFGDLSYALGAAHVWEEWLHMVEPFAQHVPLMIGVGNHEYDHLSGGANGKDPSGVTQDYGFHPEWGDFGDDSQGECGVPTSQRFTMPSSSVNGSSSNGVFWYSYDFASVHTIMLSSEHNLTKGSVQHEWFVQDLQSVNRTVTPWLILELHRPLYESEIFWYDNAVGVGMRYEIEDLLKQYKVDLVLAGHYHSYLRTCDGLYQSKCDNGGPMHITVGSAGATLDVAMLYPNHWTDTFITQEWGYGKITVMNASALQYQFIKAGGPTDVVADGSVRDDVWILRER